CQRGDGVGRRRGCPDSFPVNDGTTGFHHGSDRPQGTAVVERHLRFNRWTPYLARPYANCRVRRTGGMFPGVSIYQSDPTIDSALDGQRLRVRYGTLLHVDAYAPCVRRDLKNPYQEFGPPAADVYHCANELCRNEVDQFGGPLF